MIQNSVNQLLGAAAGAAYGVKRMANEKAALNTKQVEAGANQIKLQQKNVDAAYNEIDSISKTQEGIDTSTPEGAAKWKEMEADKVRQGMSIGDMQYSQDQLSEQLLKKSGMKPMMRDGQKVGWTDGHPDRLTTTDQSIALGALQQVQASRVARKNAMIRAAEQAEGKQEQANTNFVYMMGQKVDLNDPENAGLAKVYEKYKKENK